MIVQPEDLGRILLAMLLGGLLGAEREYRDKAAGFRTLILISVGACLFTLWSLHMGDPTDPTRIAANIVTGIGFLGAGVILREGGRIMGLTTAAMIWLSAALGMGVGSGQIGLSVAATLIILVVMWFFPVLERAIDRLRETRTYEITLPTQAEKVTRLEAVFRQCGLRGVQPSAGQDGGSPDMHLGGARHPRRPRTTVEGVVRGPGRSWLSVLAHTGVPGRSV